VNQRFYLHDLPIYHHGCHTRKLCRCVVGENDDITIRKNIIRSLSDQLAAAEAHTMEDGS
jgi:hypothetical protein